MISGVKRSTFLAALLRKIAENAGDDGSVVLKEVLTGSDAFGYNAKTGTFEDLKKAGVIDPTKVTRIAVENAASIAGMVLTTESVVSEIPEDKPEMPMPPGGGMGGMM